MGEFTEETAPQHPGEGREILLVEDHEATAEMVCTLLQEEGYHVTWVAMGREAVEVFSDLPTDNHDSCPDLILLDLTLPDMESPEVMRHIMETHKSAPPIILLSAKPKPVMEQAASSMGAQAVISKPFEIETLLESIEQVLA